jgi:hypothetical protein
MHGKGKLFWKNGDKFEGSWVNNKRDGFGIKKWDSGVIYEGHYHNDIKHGEGILKKNGKKYNEKWENGVKI